MRAMPRSSASWLTSRSFTGMPNPAKLIAMPPPIVPAPKIGAFRDQLIDDAEPLCLLCRDVAAAHDHLHRRLWADQPRQALGSAAPRQNADQYLGQADLGARDGNAIVRGQRDLEAAAQRIAMDRRDDRLLAGVEDVV